MSAVTLAVIFGFIGCALLLRVLANLPDERRVRQPVFARVNKARVPRLAQRHAMMDE